MLLIRHKPLKAAGVLGLTFIWSVACAGDFWMVGGGSHAHPAFLAVDASSITFGATDRRGWLYSLTFNGSKLSEVAVMQVSYHCTAKERAVLQLTYYTPDTLDVIATHVPPQTRYTAMPPGTLGEALQRFVCRQHSGQPIRAAAGGPTRIVEPDLSALKRELTRAVGLQERSWHAERRHSTTH